MIGRAILDNSALQWLRSPKLSAPRRAETFDAMNEDLICRSLLLLLESGYSARDRAEHRELAMMLLPLPMLPIDDRVERLAFETQAELCGGGHHRIPPADLVTASLAHRHRVAVLHYDHHFDLIREHTSLRFESVWLAEPGSL